MRSEAMREALAALRRGEPVVFPTETVYGLGVSVQAAPGPEVLYRVKRRERGKPVAWLVAGPEDLDRYGTKVPDLARRLARAYWPGPLTLIVEAGDAVALPYRSSSGSIGLRMPKNSCALRLIEALGCPIATTSANISGRPAVGIADALDPALAAQAAAVVADGGDGDKSGVASTVLDCTVSPPRIVREGGIGKADILSLA